MNNCYIYVLFRPWNLEPCYIGKGTLENEVYWRPLIHIRAGVNHSNRHLANVFKKAGEAEIPWAILHEGLSEATALEYEIALILAIGRADLGLGPLCNQTNGGEGNSGWVPSEETRLNIGKALKGRIIPVQTRLAAAKAASERVWTDEMRANVAATKVGKKRDPETAAKNRINGAIQLRSPDHRAAVGRANSARVWTNEMRKAHGIRMAEVWKRDHPEGIS